MPKDLGSYVTITQDALLGFFNREHFQTYYTPLAHIFKSIEAAILYQELIQRYQYHLGRNELRSIPDHGEGWFYHTKEHIEERTAINRYGQDKAIAVLKKFDLIETLQFGMPCKRYIRLSIKGAEQLSKYLSRKPTFDRQESSPSTDKPVYLRPTDSLYIKEPKEEPKEDKSELPFGRISLYFYEKLKALHPKLKKPHLEKWSKDLILLAEEGNSEEDIIKVIDYVISTHGQVSSNDFCWANIILSPTSLRNNFPKLWAQMMNAPPKKDPEANEKIAKAIFKKFPRQDNDIRVEKTYIEFITGVNAPSVEIKFTDKDFKEKCLEQLKKRNLVFDGL